MNEASSQLAEAREIPEPEKRAREIARIASAAAFLRSGDPEQDDLVSRAFRESFEAGLEVEDPDRELSVLSQVLGYVQVPHLDEAAVELARSHPLAWARSELIADVARRSADRDRERALAWLDEALEVARSEEDPIRRGTARAAIGKELMALGAVERGESALAEAESDALEAKDLWATPRKGVYGPGTAVYLLNAILYGYVEGERGDRARELIDKIRDDKLSHQLRRELRRLEEKASI